MNNFITGKNYEMRSICDQNCVWSYKVIKRTAKTVTLENPEGKVKTCRISVWEGVEQVKPLGSYSMSPVLTAEKMV